MDLKSIGMGVAFALLWASAFTATRVVVVAMPPLTALVIRFAISGVIGMALAWAVGQRVGFSRDEWRRLVIFGICQNALYLGLAWIAMQWIEASASSIIASMMPLIVALIGWLAFGERLRTQAVVGLILGVIGAAIIMTVRLTHGLNLAGAGLTGIAVVALAVATLAVRGSGSGPNVIMAVGLQMLIGAAVLLPFALLLEAGRPIEFTPRAVVGLTYSILGPGLLATWIWLRLVARVGAVRAATFHFLSPFLGVAIAAAFLGERFGISDVIGALVIAAGIYLVQASKVPQAEIYPASRS